MKFISSFFLTALLAGAASAETSQTCSVNVSLGEDGQPICSNVCQEGQSPIWFDGVIYKRPTEGGDSMVAIKFVEGQISDCMLVEYQDDSQLSSQQEALEACLSANETPTSVLTCPAGFTKIGESCYVVTPKSQSYGKNRDHCRSISGELAVIEDQEEQDRVTALLNDIVYLGITDKAQEKVFVDVKNRKAPYFNWKEGEPNNYGGNEDCVIIKPGNGRVFLWWDFTCSRSNRGLCKAEQQVVEYPICAEGQIMKGGSCYFMPEQPMNYEEGKNFCRNNGGYLVYINDQQEQDFVAETFQSSVLTGLSDTKTEGKFIVPYYGVPFYTNWSEASANTAAEDCVVMDESAGYSWSTVNCDAQQRVVCEVPVTSANSA